MEKTTRRLPIVERDEWLLPAEQELNATNGIRTK